MLIFPRGSGSDSPHCQHSQQLPLCLVLLPPHSEPGYVNALIRTAYHPTMPHLNSQARHSELQHLNDFHKLKQSDNVHSLQKASVYRGADGCRNDQHCFWYFYALVLCFVRHITLYSAKIAQTLYVATVRFRYT